MKLVILDFDGTLADTVPHVINCIIKCIDKFNLRKLEYNDILKFNGAVLGNVLKELGAKEEDISEIKKYYASIFLEDLSDIILYPNVYETLNYLKQQNIIITMATNRGRNTLIPLLSYLNLEDIVEYIVCESDVENKKPYPDMVNKIREEFNISPDKIIIVGDTHFDIEMGKNSDCKTCAVYYAEEAPKSLIDSNPDYLINDFSILKKILK